MGVRVREKVKDSGEWWVFIHYRGQRRARKVGLRRDALDLAKKVRKKIHDKEFSLEDPEETPPVLFADYAKTWMKNHVRLTCKDSSIQGYRHMLDSHVLPAFGTTPLPEISREAIKEFCRQKKEAGLALRSIRYMVATISGVLSMAIEEGLIQANQAARPGKFLKVGDRREMLNPLTEEEGRHLLQTACEKMPRFHPFVLTALRTGMRQGELVGLQWGDIDWNGKFIEVRRSCWKGTMTTTKSGKIRRVDMSDQLLAVLRSWRALLAQKALSGGEEIGELVFPSEAGTPRDSSHIRRDFLALLKKAQMRHVRFHDLRHTFASLLLQNGESPVYVKDQMGHHSIKVTVDTYGHLIPGSNRKAVCALDDPSWKEKPGKTATQAQPEKERGSAACANPP